MGASDIQVIEASDAPDFYELRNRILKESDFLMLRPDEGMPPPANAQKTISNLKNAGLEIFLASRAGSLVGYLAAIRIRETSRRHVVEISMGILKSCWGKGLGADLVQACEQWCGPAGVERIQFTVSTDNDRSLSLFLRRGYEVEGLMKGVVRLQTGKLTDKLMVAKLLASG